MNSLTTPKRNGILTGALVFAVIACTFHEATAGTIPKAWMAVYQELHPNEYPTWKSRDDAANWAVKEQKRVRPILLSVLRGERSDISWAAALPIARAIPDDTICRVLLQRVDEIIRRNSEGRITRFSPDAIALANAVDVFAKAGHTGARDIVTELALQERQAFEVVEHSVKTLQSIGDRSTLQKLRRVPLRRDLPSIDRLCGLTEKIITSRIQGRDPTRTAQRELRSVAGAYVEAIQNTDYSRYIRTLPFHAAKEQSESEVEADVFGNPQLEPVLAALKKAIDSNQRFKVDSDALRAHMLISHSYQLDCVLEVDGWKIAGITRVGSPNSGR